MKQEKRTIDDSLHRIISEINMSEDGERESTHTNVSKEDEIETIHVYIYREEPKQNTIVDADRPKEKTQPLSLSRGLCKYIFPRKVCATLASAFSFVLST